MKPKSPLRHLLCIASCAVLAISYSHAATLYWDGGTVNIETPGNGVSLGTAGNWDTTLTNWDQGNALAHAAWVNTNNDTAFFGGTAANVTLTAPITVGGLGFSSNSGYTITAGTQGLTFGTGTTPVRMINTSGGSSTAAISGTVTGTGNLVFTSVAPDVFSTLTLSGTSTGGWSGTTTINAGFTLALSGLNQGLSSTTGGITLNGGNITLTNADTDAERILNRIKDDSVITSNGGTLTYSNTTAASTRVFDETIGSVDLVRGQTNFVNTLDKSAGSQSLTLSGLTRTGAANTSAVTFANAGGLNITTDIIRVNGIATSTAAGQIIGPWATYGTSAGSQTDYAIYDSDGAFGRVRNASIGATTEDLWVSGANVTLGGATTLTATRTINSLRYTGGALALDLGAFNLETNGVLNGGSGLTISGTGALTTPSGGGNLYLTPGAAAITVSAPITNSGGNVAVVKSGSGTLTLSSTTSSYSGGTVLNAGSLVIGNVNNIGGASANLTFGGTATLAPSAAVNFTGGTLTVNAGAFGTITGSGATAFATTTGTGTLRYTSGANSANLNLGDASGLTGNLEFRLTGNAGYSSSSATVQFSSLGDGVGSVLQTGGGQTDSSAPVGQRANIVLNGGAPLVFDNRRIELLPRIASNHTVGATQLRNDSSNAANTWVINTALSNQVSGEFRFLELAGSNTGNNAFNGIINDGNLGGFISLRKDGSGTWILGGSNTHSGGTTLIAGRLHLSHPAALGTGTFTINGATFDNTSGASMTCANNNPIAWNGDSTFTGTHDLNLGTGNVTLGGNRNLTISASTLTVGGTISGGAGIQKLGAGTLVLNGSNSYSGATTVNAGTLRLGNTNSLGFGGLQATAATSGTTVSNGFTLDLNGATAVSEPITLNGTGIGANGAMINNSGTVASIGSGISGITIPTATTGSTYSAAPTVTISGTGTGATATASLGLTTASISSITAGGVNWAVGNTLSVTGGGGTGAIATVTSVSSGAITGLNITTAGSGYTGAPTTLARITGANNAAGATITGNATNFTVTGVNMTAAGSGYTGTPTYTFSGNATPGSLTLSSVTLATNSSIGGTGDIMIGAVVAESGGARNLTKVGAGTLGLSGMNTYTGATSVSLGTLALLGGSQASAITVEPGASLGFMLGSSTTSASTVALNGTVKITGTTGASSYLLMTASGGITGTPVLFAPVPGYTLVKANSDTELRLNSTGGGDPFTSWSGGAAFGDDANSDGVKNGMAWVLGASDPSANAVGLLPVLDNTTDPDFFIFTYRRDDDANSDVTTTIKAEYGSDLAGWTTALASGDIIITATDDGAGAGIDSVQVKIRRTLAVGGKLFARLNVVKVP